MSKRATFLVLYLIAFASGIAWNMMPSLSDVITRGVYQLSDLEYGSLYAFFISGAIITSLFCGTLGNKVTFHIIISISIVFGLLSCIVGIFIGLILSYTYVLASTNMFILGLSIGGIIVGLGNTLLQLSKKYKTAALILMFACLGVGSAITPIYIKKAITHYKLGVLYIPLICIYILGILGTYFNKHIRKVECHENQYSSILDIILFWKVIPKSFWLLVIALFLYSINEISFWDWGIIYLSKIKNFSPVSSGFASTAYWTSYTIGEVLFSIIFIFFRYKKVYLAIPPTFIVAYLLLIYSSSEFFLLLSFCLAGIAGATFFPLTIRLASEHFPKLGTRVFGILLGIYFLGSGICSYSIGFFETSLSINILTIFKGLPFIAMFCFIFIVSFYRTGYTGKR